MNSLFGTDGIRAKVGTPPITANILINIATAIGRWATNQNDNVNIIIAQDTRTSCDWVKANIKAGLLGFNIKTFDAQILPTPALFHLMKKHKNYTHGILISASHNPYYDNGIKIINNDLKKITQEDELAISQLSLRPIDLNYKQFGQDNCLTNAQEEYISIIKSMFTPNFLNNIKIVLDLANGAAYDVAGKIFSSLGATVITINNKPNGTNINLNCGALHPEELREKVIQEKAFMGFAFDGDADRVIAVNKEGIIKNGDDILALLSTHPDYKNTRTIVSTIMANQGLEDYLQKQGKKLIRTPVGDRYVSQALEENNLILGGEQSGHIIIRTIINTGDGILIALKILQTMLLTNNINMDTFTKFPQLILNLPMSIKVDLNTQPYNEIIESAKLQIPQGRISVRYSGTEPLIRIMVEDQDEATAKKIAQSLADKLKEAIK